MVHKPQSGRDALFLFHQKPAEWGCPKTRISEICGAKLSKKILRKSLKLELWDSPEWAGFFVLLIYSILVQFSFNFISLTSPISIYLKKQNLQNYLYLPN